MLKLKNNNDFIKKKANYLNKNYDSYKKLFKLFVFLLIIENTKYLNLITIFKFIKDKIFELRINILIKEYVNTLIVNTNIDLNDEFF